MGSLIYVLDESTVGLHEIEKAALLEQVAALQSSGSTVIVVEHDPATPSHCDWLIELGRGAGRDGGEIIAQGPPWAHMIPALGLGLSSG
jgi:excinuclease ABC subunit A